MSFPEKLKKLRKEKGLTQEELAKAIYVSRTLITKYENGSVYPTKENVEKLALYFNVNLSDLIDNNDTAQLALKNNDLANKINNIISIICVTISSIFSFLAFIPCVKVHYYDYSENPPILNYNFINPIKITLKNNNPIVIISLITVLINLILGIFNFKFKKNIWIKLFTYILFIINLFLIFFSIVFVIMYSSNNLYDFA